MTTWIICLVLWIITGILTLVRRHITHFDYACAWLMIMVTIIKVLSMEAS